MKILGTLACVGVLGMGVIGNSVMAADRKYKCVLCI
jgi:hypothetical protein